MRKYHLKFGLVAGIYAICHRGKPVYVGSSMNCFSRYGHHVWALAAQRHRCAELQKLWDEEEKLTWTVLEECPPAALQERENYWLALHAKTILNESPTATGKGRIASAATRAKLSKVHRGRILTPLHRARLSIAAKGKIIRPETRTKLRAAFLGRKLTEEHKRKISAAGRGRKDGPETRRKKRIAALNREANKRRLASLVP